MILKSKLAMVCSFFFVFALAANSFAFRAAESQDVMNGVAPGASALDSTTRAGATLNRKPALGLRTVLVRNLDQPVHGTAATAAENIVQGLMSTGTLTFNGEEQGLSSDGVEKDNGSGFQAQLRKIHVDNLGFQHVRIAQTYQGLPVVGSETVVHINNKGVIYQINGKYLQSFSASITPSIDADAALSIGMTEMKGRPGLHLSKEPSLVIYGSHLAYCYVLSHEPAEGVEPGQWWYYVDAHTGDVIFRYNNIQYSAPVQDSGGHTGVSGKRLSGEDGSLVTMNGFYESGGSGNYFLYNFNTLWGIYDEDVYDWEQQASRDWDTSDRAAVSCAKNYADIQSYISGVLNRNSFDDNGAFARANVHTGTNYVNAYWDGYDFHFGDGDGYTSNELTVLDIAAHEVGHALTQYTSSLVYAYESGALNEAYSDIHGCAVEFYTQPDGTENYPNAVAGHSDWLMGEDAWLDGVALRDMRDPQRYGLPSYYKGTNWYSGIEDHGGVHTNNGPACFAYYLLSEGGSGTNDGHEYGPITGVGKVKAAAVALRANYYYHTSSDQYIDAREHWISAAVDLGVPESTVEAVWSAVGVDGDGGDDGDDDGDAGSVVQSWIPSGNEEPWGIAATSDGSVWVGDGWGSNSIYKYSAKGSFTGSSWNYPWSPLYGPADCAFNSNTGMVWVLDVGSDNALHEMNPSSGFTGRKIVGPWTESQRGLAYDPTTDTWYAGGWNEGAIYHIRSSGELIDVVFVALSISGLAYNPETKHLFVMENASPNNIVYVLDPFNYFSELSRFEIPFSDNGGAGLDIDDNGFLWAVEQGTNKVYQIRSGEEKDVGRGNYFPVIRLLVLDN